MKKVIITQSNYIPWKGYFDSIAMSDVFVIYDHVQYTKRDWRNRNLITTPTGPQWLTIPVINKGMYNQSIEETKVSDTNWAEKHWKSISLNYNKAPYFQIYKDIFENHFFSCNEVYLSKINLLFIKEINKILGINTPIRFSSEFSFSGSKTDCLIQICKQLGATHYYTGPAAKNYINESLFQEANIKLTYIDYSGYPTYKQVYEPFNHFVSIIDTIFNTGPSIHQYLKNTKL
jgi:hypothetical protein